ncbi:hypothetical protein [uncultured Clostridium sp.]|uniref:hypothetical protein n=1 Tax=uncultured Clostridium sp. TaxID=59620 RepID=UPI0032171233
MDKINKLKEVIINNPSLPIRFFVGEDGNYGDCQYEENSISNVTIDYLTLYNGEYLNEEELKEKLYYNLYDDFKSEEEAIKHIDIMIKNKNFEKTISVFLS